MIGSSLAIMTVAGLGMISPVVGAVIQNIGTFVVVVISQREGFCPAGAVSSAPPAPIDLGGGHR